MNEPNEREPAFSEPADGAREPAPGPPPSNEPAPTEHAPRRLYRSRDDEWLGGVAGGLAEYFGTDPTLVRVLFIVAALVSAGFAVIGYVIAWIIVPEDPGAGRSTAARNQASSVLGPLFWGGMLIIGGVIVLLLQLDRDIDLPPWEVGLSSALILVGVLMLFEARRGFNGGLVAFAVILTGLLALSTATAFDLPTDGAFGDATHVVNDATDLDDEYSHAFGSMTVDLGSLALPEGTTALSVSMVFGDVELRLPADIPYRISADSVFASIEGEGIEWDGVAADRDFTSPGYAEADRRLDIEMSVVFGSGRVGR